MPNMSELFGQMVVDAGAIRMAMHDQAAADGLARLASEFQNKSLIIMNLSWRDRPQSLLLENGLMDKLATAHIDLSSEDPPGRIASALDGMKSLPITINVTPENVLALIEALVRVRADFLNLTLNLVGLSGSALSMVLASPQISAWGVTCYRDRPRDDDTALSMPPPCAGRLKLFIASDGQVYGCAAMMATEIGAMGILTSPDQIMDTLGASPLEVWAKDGPKLTAREVKLAKGDRCAAHLNALIKLAETASEKDEPKPVS